MKDFLKNSAKRIKSGRVLFEKFDVFMNHYESLWTAAAIRRKTVQHL